MSDSKIRLLDAHLIDCIAAGEVVERPASVVKELVENALDAGAGSVQIDLQGGGLTKLTVSDDGCGMTPEDARLCVMRHATSKLRVADDLFCIQTLGFRGEALSSIAAVSHVTITTRQEEATAAFRLEMRGGTLVEAGEIGAPRGTTIEVSDLFFNTPARRKFMRAPATEQAHAVESVIRVMLAARRGGAVVTHGTRRLLDIPEHSDGLERIAAALGNRLARSWPLRSEADGVRVAGFIGTPELDRADSKSIWLFVNGRFVRDRMLLRAVTEAYRGNGHGLNAVIHIDVDPAAVDVNVHPQKLEVRFADAGTVFRTVTTAIMAALANPLSAAARVSAPQAAPVVAASRSASTGVAPLQVAEAAARLPYRAAAAPAPNSNPAAQASLPGVTAALVPRPASSSLAVLGAIADRYVVCDDRRGGLLLADWPTLARRQILTQLIEEAQEGEIRRQVLLLPDSLTAEGPWAAWLEENWGSLVTFGLEVEPVAPLSYAVRAIPEAVGRAVPRDVALAAVQAAFAVARSNESAPPPWPEHPVLHACAAAAGGLPPAPEVARALLEDMELDNQPGIARLNAAALGRLFKGA